MAALSPMLKKVTPALQDHQEDVEILSWSMKLSLLFQKRMDLGKPAILSCVDNLRLCMHEKFSSFSLLHRPNLCQTRKVYETQTYSYTYQRYCRFCGLYCKRTRNCDGGIVNVTKTEVDCCDGFAEDPSLSSSGGYYGGRSRRSGYSRGSKSLRRNGCPMSK